MNTNEKLKIEILKKELRKKIDIEMKKNEKDIDCDYVDKCLEEYGKIHETPIPELASIKSALYYKQNKKARKKTIFFRYLISIAACFIILISTQVIMLAFDIDIFSAVGSWTKQTIEYINNNFFKKENEEFISTENVRVYETIDEAFEKEDVQAQKIYWLPEGYHESKVFSTYYSEDFTLNISYSDNKNNIDYTIEPLTNEYSELLINMDKAAEKYIIKNIDYYIFLIEDIYQINWKYNDFFCIINAKAPITDVINILNSLK